MENYAFFCETGEAHSIKILFELLQHNIKFASFDIYPDRFHLCASGLNGKCLLVLDLHKENFREYICPEPITVGLNLSHIHKQIKPIKKKDSIIFSIKKGQDSKGIFDIQIIPYENTRTVKAQINIQDIESIPIEIPDGYQNRPINVYSSDFQKMCKELNDIGKNIEIVSQDNWVQFSCDADKVYNRSVSFGQKPIKLNTTYKQNFQAIQFTRIIKVSGLCKNIHLYTQVDLPLKICCKVGELGTLTMYLLSIEQFKEMHDREE